MKRALLVLGSLLLAGAALACEAQELGRLFFTPAERAALDARREARVPDRPNAPVVASPTTRLDGYVKRSRGRSTIWLNGEAVSPGSPDAPRLDARGVELPYGDGSRRVELQPGEVLDRGSGEVTDPLHGGTIQVRPAK